ncbi:MAG: SMI1/KNR4 family protein [Trebonia sp.]
MDDSRTIAQSLAEVRDTGSAFAFIDWFAREWRTPLRDGDGCTTEEVAAVEEQLELRLPASLSAFYRMLGRRNDLTSNQDRLIPLNALRVEDGVLVHRIEAQGCASWGVRVSDLGLADPPVVICEGYQDGSPWRPFLGSFSLAAVEMVLYESIFAEAAGCHDNRELDPVNIARLEERYERLPLPGYPGWWQPGVQQGVRWFSGPDVLIREDSRTWLWVLARSPASLTQVRHTLPGEWLMVSE